MLGLFYTLCIILGILAVTYPKEFPMLMRNPEMFIQVVGMESRRRWMMLKLWPMLQLGRMQLMFTRWKYRRIIEEAQAKQQAQEEAKID